MINPMEHLLFIDDRPCGKLRPCSFNYNLFRRKDVLPILVRFPDTFREFSSEYLTLTEGFPAFHILPGSAIEDEARRFRAWCDQRALNPDRFCCMSEPQMEYGHRLGGLLGLPTLPAGTTRALRHKPTMKRWFRAAGLRTAEFMEVDSADQALAFARKVGFPIILKPCCGFGTLRTYLIEDEAGIEDHRGQIEGEEETMVESFVTDEEFECCALLQDGVVLDTFVSSMPASPLAISQGAISANISLGSFKHQIPVDFDGITQTIVDTFGLGSGYLHMEWFIDVDSGRVTIGECALRYPGCEIAKNHGLAYGFDIADVTADLYLGRRVRLDYTLSRCVGDLLLPYRPGRVRAVSTRESLERLPGVIEAHVGVTVGEVLPRLPNSSFNCAGWVFVEGDSPQNVEARMRGVAATFELHT